MLDAIAAAFLSLDGVSCFVGRVDGEVVATALGITIDDVTGVFNVATMPDHRGRGHGAALTARVVRDGFERGARLAFLQSSALGHRVYQRLGFRDVEEYVLLSRPPPVSGVLARSCALDGAARHASFVPRGWVGVGDGGGEPRRATIRRDCAATATPP